MTTRLRLSRCRIHSTTRFQLALFWSTILRSASPSFGSASRVKDVDVPLAVPLARSLRVVVYDLRAPSPRQSALPRSTGSDSRKGLKSGLRLGLAQVFPVAVGAVVLEIRQVGVLRR